MKWITLAATAGLAVILLTGSAGASESLIVSGTSLLAADARSLSGDSSADIYGVGGGKVQGGLQKFNLSAHEGPNGDFGHVAVTFYDPLGRLIVSYSVDVTCVHIHTLTSTTYDRGIIRGVVKSVSPVPNLVGLDVGDPVLFGIKDGGTPSSGPVDDFFAPNSDALPAGLPCTYFYTGNLDNVTQGNVNIKGP